MRTFYALDSAAAELLDRAAKVARDVAEKEAATTDREARFPRAAMKALGEAGLLGLTVPKKWGGLEQGPRTFAAVAETLGRACASTAMVYKMHISAANVYVAAAATQPAHEKVCREIAAGRHLTTLAFSEKGSRSHFWAPVSKTTGKGGELSVTADKSWVTTAGEADSYVTSALALDSKGPTESTLYSVGKDAKGLSVVSRFDGLGLRGNASAPMALRDVELDEKALLTAPGKGFDAMMAIVLPWFQVGQAAISCGLGECALAATAAHLNAARFEHMGAALSSLPNLRANVAQMRMEIDRSRAQLVHALGAMEKPGDHTMPAVLATKAQAAEMAIQVTDLAMRTCGGAAFSKHLPIERTFRDARASAVMAPTTDVLKDFIGKAVLGLPLF